MQEARSIQDVIDRVDALIARPEEQRNLLGMVYHFLETREGGPVKKNCEVETMNRELPRGLNTCE